jgi:hypothetical protein
MLHKSRFRGQPQSWLYISSGLLKIDCPQSMLVVVFGVVISFLDYVDEVVAIEDAGDGNEGARAGVIGNESEGGVPKPRNCSVEFGKAIRAGGSPANDDHWPKVTRLGFSA